MVEFSWFLPTTSVSEVIGPPTRTVTLDHLIDVVRAVEDASYYL